MLMLALAMVCIKLSIRSLLPQAGITHARFLRLHTIAPVYHPLSRYCKFGNFREYFIFANNVKTGLRR